MASPHEQKTKEALERIEAAISQIMTSEKWEEYLTLIAHLVKYQFSGLRLFKELWESNLQC